MAVDRLKFTLLSLLLVVLLSLFFITFMQDTYSYIPETNHVSRTKSVAATLYLLFMPHDMLFPILNVLHFYVSTFRSILVMQCPVLLLYVVLDFVLSWYVAQLLRYFLNYFETVQIPPTITGITLVFTFHMRCVSIVRCSHFRIFSASFLMTFLLPEIVTSFSLHVPFSLSRIMMSDLLLGVVLSICTIFLPTIWLP